MILEQGHHHGTSHAQKRAENLSLSRPVLYAHFLQSDYPSDQHQQAYSSRERPDRGNFYHLTVPEEIRQQKSNRGLEIVHGADEGGGSVSQTSIVEVLTYAYPTRRIYSSILVSYPEFYVVNKIDSSAATDWFLRVRLPHQCQEKDLSRVLPSNCKPPNLPAVNEGMQQEVMKTRERKKEDATLLCMQ